MRILDNRFGVRRCYCTLLARSLRKRTSKFDKGLFGDLLELERRCGRFPSRMRWVGLTRGGELDMLYDDHLQVAVGSACAGMRSAVAKDW